MTVVLLTSATGAPGVTTTALGLTLLWPRDVLLVDHDRDPAQAVLAGFLQGSDGAGRGLTALAGSHRDHQPATADLVAHCVPLAADPQVRRMFLPGFTRPGAAQVLAPLLPALAAGFTELAEAGTDVVIDAGRLGADGPASALLEVTDELLVVTRTSLRALAALRLHLPALTQRLEQTGVRAHLGLVLVGEGQPYGAGEITSQFGVPVMASVAADPAAAAVLSDGAARPRRFERSDFTRSLRAAANRLAQGRRTTRGAA